MPEDGSERVGRNQALFREVNERLEALAEDVSVQWGRLDTARGEKQLWVCECWQTDCVARIELSIAEYEQIRAHGDRFAVAPGPHHVAPPFERVLNREHGYWIIEKIGTAAEIARAEDPRDTPLRA